MWPPKAWSIFNGSMFSIYHPRVVCLFSFPTIHQPTSCWKHWLGPIGGSPDFHGRSLHYTDSHQLKNCLNTSIFCQGTTIPLKYLFNDSKNEFARIQHWVRPNTLGNKRGGVPKRSQGGHLCQNQWHCQSSYDKKTKTLLRMNMIPTIRTLAPHFALLSTGSAPSSLLDSIQAQLRWVLHLDQGTIIIIITILFIRLYPSPVDVWSRSLPRHL